MPEELITAFQEPLRLLTDPNARTWWPALIGAFVIAFTYEALTARGGRVEAVKRSFMLMPILHPSSLVDLKLILIRGFVKALFVATIPWSAKYIGVKTIGVAYAVYGAPPIVLKGTVLIGVHSVGFLLVSDFSRYLLHRLMHRVSFLWRFHQVHHSAEVLTPFSLYRMHPVEQLLQALRGLLAVGITAGLFAWLSMGKASVWTLYGVPGVMILFGVLGANLRHSHTWIPYPSWVERFLISPAQHQQHHAVRGDGQRRNYGSVLAVWDGLSGSLQLSRDGRPEDFGLLDEHRDHDPRSVISVLLDPLKVWRRT